MPSPEEAGGILVGVTDPDRPVHAYFDGFPWLPGVPDPIQLSAEAFLELLELPGGLEAPRAGPAGEPESSPAAAPTPPAAPRWR